MMLFGVTLAKRYTPRQKSIFLSQAHKYFQDLGYKVSYQNIKSKLSSVTNMVIGELSTTSVVVACAYDTPSKAALPNYLYYPFNRKKNLQQENINLIIQFILMGLCFLGIYFLLSHSKGYSLLFKIVSFLISGILGFTAYKLMKGYANKVNFNRCSASVALIAKLALKLKEKKSIAFVLLDQNVNSYEGLKLLKNEIKNSKKIIIYLDSLSFGTKLVCAHNEKMNNTSVQLLKQLKPLELIDKTYGTERCEDTMLHFFTDMLVLTSGEIIQGQLAVKNSRSSKDYEVDMNRLESIEKGIETFLCEV